MKKLINTFLKVGQIISIVDIACLSLATVIVMIVAIFVPALWVDVLGLLFALGAPIVSLVLTVKAVEGVNAANTKADAKVPAILAIVGGVLAYLPFSTAAGIMMLCLAEDQYPLDKVNIIIKKAEDKEVVADVKAEEVASDGQEKAE